MRSAEGSPKTESNSRKSLKKLWSNRKRRRDAPLLCREFADGRRGARNREDINCWQYLSKSSLYELQGNRWQQQQQYFAKLIVLKMVFSQKLHEAFKGAVERITGPRTVSAFKEKGVLTVDEFVQAGDNLVAKCPTWSWESGDPSKRKPYLPPDKQYLITRNVPCLRRAISVEEEYEAAGGEVLLDDEEYDGWLATHGAPRDNKGDEESVPSMDTLERNERRNIHSISSYFGGGDEEEIPDMAEYEESENVVESDAATLQPPYLVVNEPDDDNILRTRTYDVSITYDKYYQTPRVWLTGYDESRMLLQPELVLEDVSQDHAHKTVTVEDHPHMSGKHASVHPCRHGAVMKKIIDVLMAHGVEPEVDKYLFLFLKFMATVIPTIEYDYTVDFDLGN